MSEAVRSAWGLAVASPLGGETARLRGAVLDAGGGAALFARSVPDAQIESVELPDVVAETFDAALSISRLQYAENPAADIAAMARACRPGGVVMLIVPHAMQEDMTDAAHAFTLRGLHSLASAAGLDVEYVRSVNPPEGGVLRRELDAFRLQTARHILIPDELYGWVDVLDDQRPMLLVCLGAKRGNGPVA
ncbi:MAG: hypothetical protein WCJ13_05035 [Coriobacteriia bacterium]